MLVLSSWHGSAVLSDTKFLIHGGYNGNNALSDTFIFDIGERQLTIAHSHFFSSLGFCSNMNSKHKNDLGYHDGKKM